MIDPLYFVKRFFSIFRKGLDYSGLSEQLSQSKNSFTVFAPTDHAFAIMDKALFDKIFDAKDTVKKVRTNLLNLNELKLKGYPTGEFRYMNYFQNYLYKSVFVLMEKI